jgi:hypothetical protein
MYLLCNVDLEPCTQVADKAVCNTGCIVVSRSFLCSQTIRKSTLTTSVFLRDFNRCNSNNECKATCPRCLSAVDETHDGRLQETAVLLGCSDP